MKSNFLVITIEKFINIKNIQGFMDAKVTIMFDNRKHNYGQVLDRVIQPFVCEVVGAAEDLEEHYSYRGNLTP